VTVARRLTAIEADLDPTQRVVAWLAEAHAYDTFDAYTRMVLAGDPPDLPLDRLPREAIAAVRGRRSRGSPDVEAAVREAIRGVVFRIHLVLRIIDLTDGALRHEGLVLALLTAHVSLTLEAEERAATVGIHLAHQRDLLLDRVAELLALQEARRRVEERYLAGHPALFPATARQWDEQLRNSQETAVMTLRLAELEGAEPIDEARQLVPRPDRIEACIGDLVEVARIKTLDDMGEGHAAAERIRRWLGPKLASTAR
jgi:hypothetical protein